MEYYQTVANNKGKLIIIRAGTVIKCSKDIVGILT